MASRDDIDVLKSISEDAIDASGRAPPASGIVVSYDVWRTVEEPVVVTPASSVENLR
jgi:hypothetical protein